MYKIWRGFFFLFYLFQLTSELINSFNHKNSDSYSNFFIKNEYLYLTGTNYVFRLSSINISEHNFLYKERLINTTSTKISRYNNQTKNFIKFMYWREQNNDIIICGTNIGKPHLYNLKASDLTNQLEYNGIFLCPGIASLNNLGLISFDINLNKIKRIKTYGIMYSAIWHTNEYNNTPSIFSRYGIYRKQIETNQNLLKTINSPFWLWEPNFISIIEDNLYVYIFFTEYSIEEYASKFNINNIDSLNNKLSNITIKSPETLKRISRVARVCKNDEGFSNKKWKDFWSTFRKKEIKCNCNPKLLKQLYKYDDNFSFFDDSTSYQTSFKNLIFLKKLNEKKIIAIFYQKFTNLTENNYFELSILCEFDSVILDETMRYKSFWTNDNHNNKTDSLVDCDFNKNNYDYNFYENTILNGIYYGNCKIILPNKVTALTIHAKAESKNKFIYLSDSRAQIIKIKHSNDGIYILENIYNLTNYYYRFSHDKETDIKKLNSFNNITDIILNQNSLYLGSKSYVHQIDINNLETNICNIYSQYIKCVKNNNSMWNNVSCILSIIKDGQKDDNEYFQLNNSNSSFLKSNNNQKKRFECPFKIFGNSSKRQDTKSKNNEVNFYRMKNKDVFKKNPILRDYEIYNCYNLNNFSKTKLMNFSIAFTLIFDNLTVPFIDFKLFIDDLKNITEKIKTLNRFC